MCAVAELVKEILIYQYLFRVVASLYIVVCYKNKRSEYVE